jgi:hypothetical protein
MITFKEEFVGKYITAVVLYKNGISINRILIEEFSIDLKKIKDRKKFMMLFKIFWECFMTEFLEVCSDEVCDKLEVIFKEPTSKEQFIEILEGCPANMDDIFKRAYVEFKKKMIIYERTGIADELTDFRDEISDNVMELAEVDSDTSTSFNLASVLFSSKYRYLTDRQIKFEIFKKIVAVLVVILGTLVITLLIKKIL